VCQASEAPDRSLSQVLGLNQTFEGSSDDRPTPVQSCSSRRGISPVASNVLEQCSLCVFASCDSRRVGCPPTYSTPRLAGHPRRLAVLAGYISRAPARPSTSIRTGVSDEVWQRVVLLDQPSASNGGSSTPENGGAGPPQSSVVRADDHLQVLGREPPAAPTSRTGPSRRGVPRVNRSGQPAQDQGDLSDRTRSTCAGLCGASGARTQG
jgi:hypothetical protein